MRIFGLFLLAFGIVATLIGGIGTVLAFGNIQRGGEGALAAFAMLGAFGIGMILLGVYIMRRGKPIGVQPSSAPPSANEAAHYPPQTTTRHELDGTAYSVHYKPPVRGKNSHPSVLTISTAVECKGEFHMVVESSFDRFCKRLGIAVEVQTGDEKFDEECYVRSDAPEFTAAYLNDPVKRIAILDLRRFGLLDVKLADGQLTATWTGFNPATDHRDDLSSEVAARLLLLARNLPAHQPEFDNRTGSHRKFWQVALWVALVGCALSAFALFRFTPVSTTDLFLRVGPAILLGWPVFAYLTAWLLSGTSRSHIAWGALLLGSLFLFPIGAAGLVGLLNGIPDGSPPTTHDARIVEKYTTRSKNTTKYHIRCVSWRNPGDTQSYQVSQSDFNNVVPHRSNLVVVTHEGWLGMEWLKSKRVDANPKP